MKQALQRFQVEDAIIVMVLPMSLEYTAIGGVLQREMSLMLLVLHMAAVLGMRVAAWKDITLKEGAITTSKGTGFLFV